MTLYRKFVEGVGWLTLTVFFVIGCNYLYEDVVGTTPTSVNAVTIDTSQFVQNCTVPVSGTFVLNKTQVDDDCIARSVIRFMLAACSSDCQATIILLDGTKVLTYFR